METRQQKANRKAEAKHQRLMEDAMRRLTANQYATTEFGMNDSSGTWDGQNRDSK